MPAVADVARIGGVAVSRAVRDTCIALANASTSRVERVALMAIAFLAERDEAISVLDAADADGNRELAKGLSAFDEFAREAREMFRRVDPSSERANKPPRSDN